MTKPNVASNFPELASLLKAGKGESLPYRQLFDAIVKAIPCAQVVMVSSLPRGGLQIVQPPHCPEVLVKGYNRELHTEDKLTWTAIQKGKPLKGTHAWGTGAYEGSRYVQELLEPAGLRYAAAAPLTNPVIAGYPGALHLYRKLGDPAFTDAEVELLGEIASQLNEALQRTLEARKPDSAEETPWSHRGAVRQEKLGVHVDRRETRDALDVDAFMNDGDPGARDAVGDQAIANRGAAGDEAVDLRILPA